jgi:large conductance mechanosensitive channel
VSGACGAGAPVAGRAGHGEGPSDSGARISGVPPLPGILKEFRDFVLRGNVVELAVAFVLGAAFTDLVRAFVAAFISPLITMFVGKSGLVDLHFTINSAEFLYGAFFQAALTFVTIAAVVFFFVIKPMNFLMARIRHQDEPASDAPAEDIVLLTEIRDTLREGRAH